MERRAEINPALGLDLVESRTLSSRQANVSVVIPARNEEATIGEVVSDAIQAIDVLGVTDGEVIVSASACTDDTARIAADNGAAVVESADGKGNAIIAGVQKSKSDIVCLIDGDFRYYGDEPLAASLVGPILRGAADATIADLYWRPLYPQLWLYGFFAPLAGRLFPELGPKAGTTPWSGQRAALRKLWPKTLPSGFTADLDLLLSWNASGARLRTVLADDWVNPQRPKPELMHQEFSLLLDRAISEGRVDQEVRDRFIEWFEKVHSFMAEYDPGSHDPQEFESILLSRSMATLAET